MNDLSTSSAAPCEMSQSTLVANIRQFDLTDQVYPLYTDCGYEPVLVASAVLTQRFISTKVFDYKEYVPYQLEKGKMRLYPEFIRYFMRSFMSESTENMMYCIYDNERFQGLFFGSKSDVVIAAHTIEQRFSKAFFQCLSPTLQKVYKGWVFTWDILKTRFHDDICRELDLLSVPARQNELYNQAINGDIGPYIEFLMAFDTGESYIWFQVATVVAGFIHTDKDRRYTSKKLAHWKEVTDGLLKFRVEDFITDLQDEGIFPVKKVNAIHENKWKSGGEHSRSTYSGKSKRIKSAPPKVRKDGTPWIPRAKFLKMKQEANKAGVATHKETSAFLPTANGNSIYRTLIEVSMSNHTFSLSGTECCGGHISFE